jgi:hypothetical protein
MWRKAVTNSLLEPKRLETPSAWYPAPKRPAGSPKRGWPRADVAENDSWFFNRFPFRFATDPVLDGTLRLYGLVNATASDPKLALAYNESLKGLIEVCGQGRML